MTLPLTSPFTDNTFVNKAQLDQVVASINAVPFGMLAETLTGSTITLSTTSRFAAGAVATFVLSATARVKITTSAQVVPGSATSGRYLFQSGYNTGGTAVVASFVGVGQSLALIASNTGAGGGATGTPAVGTVLLTAGTYTAYCGVTRSSGGSATDTTNTPYVLVEHIGTV